MIFSAPYIPYHYLKTYILCFISTHTHIHILTNIQVVSDTIFIRKTNIYIRVKSIWDNSDTRNPFALCVCMFVCVLNLRCTKIIYIDFSILKAEYDYSFPKMILSVYRYDGTYALRYQQWRKCVILRIIL